MRAEPRTVNCPSCGAGQSVLGGGRVSTVICAFCGTTLDAVDAFKPLSDQTKLDWPETPFRIGMEGEIDGVSVTVIGILGMIERYDGETWTWVEHQLYSPTHGYAWLSWEDGWCVFTRKTRKLGAPPWITPAKINAAENRPRLRYDGEKLSYYESGTVEITFAAGAFTFRPAIGQRRFVVSYLGKERMLHVGRPDVSNENDPAAEAQARGEVEAEVSTLLDRDATLASFGVDADKAGPAPGGVHPMQPFRRSPALLDLRNLALGTAAVALFASLALGFGEGDPIAANRGQPIGEPQRLEMRVTDADRLVGVTLWANVSNSWAWFDVEVLNAEAETVFEVSRGVEYYFGRDSDGRWTEGSRSDVIYFHPPAAGAYTVIATLAETGTWGSGGRAPTEARLSATQSVTSGVPTMLLGLFCLLLAGGLLAQRVIHYSRRWRGSDWSD